MGAFITFEGGEGSGKSTQAARLASRLQAAGYAVRLLREPGGTAVGETVRGLLLDPEHTGLDARAELLLYEASRAQLVAEVIEPALEAGETVICDRFTDSTEAYQGFGRGLSLDDVHAANQLATAGLVPSATVLIDVDPAIGIGRATGAGADRLEAEDPAFHARVREGFLRIAQREPGRVRVVDGVGTVDEVERRIAHALVDIFPELGSGRA